MSSLRVTLEQLTVHEHPNADALELAQVGLYRAVVAKGQFHTGDYAIYLPEQSVLPDELIEELGLTGKLAGSAANRIRAVRLRGEISQGVVCRPLALAHLWDQAADPNELAALAGSADYAADLGVVKWSPPVPVAMSGQAESAPELIRWIDIENIKRFPGIFEPGEEVVATEKLHGSACLLTYLAGSGSTLMSSKGVGAQQLALLDTAGNLYWRAARTHHVSEAAAAIAELVGAARVGMFGEVYGAGVQDLHYGANAGQDETIGYALFDIAVDYGDGEPQWLAHSRIDELFATLGLAVPRVPVLYAGPYDVDMLLKLAEGKETVSGTAANIREGLVVRPAVERNSDILGGRAIGKIVAEAYLLRKGGTEFE